MIMDSFFFFAIVKKLGDSRINPIPRLIIGLSPNYSTTTQS